MTPNEICREIVTRLQMGGGVCADQNYAGEWEVRARRGSPMNHVWDFADLNHVAEAIWAVGDGMTFSVQHGPFNGGNYRADIVSSESYTIESFGATEAEALTRALHAYLVASKIGDEHLAPEPEEPWIDVSESVSTVNLPEYGKVCDLKIEHDMVLKGWTWGLYFSQWSKGSDKHKPESLGGSVVKWRYAK